ncbi:MAG: hypothetical protein K8H88_00280 [Sandaracinaceae bacterium]|nr:hypothetical protein [Sandaracinaceae bacterium]
MRVSEIPEGARCATHVTAKATSLCARCGSYACPECTVLRGELEVCVACSGRVFGLGGSWLSVWAAILGFMSLGCAPAGMAAVVAALIDLSRIGGGRAPRKGAALDAIGIALGIAGTALWAYALWRFATGEPTTYEGGYEDGYDPF